MPAALDPGRQQAMIDKNKKMFQQKNVSSYFLDIFQVQKEAREIEQSANDFFGQMNSHFGGGGSKDMFADCFPEKKEKRVRQLEPI